MSGLRLFGTQGAGSAAVEALMALLDIRYDYIDAAPWGSGENVELLRRTNPLGQVPTLVLSTGAVMTESVAILLYVAQQRPDHPVSRATLCDPQVLRWLLFVATNVYAAVGVRDYPERWVASPPAMDELRDGAVERIKQAWRLINDHASGHAYTVGTELSALDLYVANMSHWHPGRRWFEDHCPRLATCVASTEAHAAVNRVWSRHF
jgi:GST-like protein